jgi:cytosine/adenosine deaminase-related metal-dependent hydrolase
MILMRFERQQPLTLLNARLVSAAGTRRVSLHIRAGRVEALGGPPLPGDRVVDLDEAFVYPGLVNAHDHLELNNFPRLKWQDRHDNARDWIAGFPSRFTTDPRLAEPLRVPLNDRLLLGGIKNLLSGVTTVGHHNPLSPALRRRDFPVRVVRHYGWSHSLLVDGDAAVARAYGRTPRDWPWVIHAAEGTDAEAAGELGRLEALGCLGPNTVLVHGVGLSAADCARLAAQGGGLVWCPSSNFFMLGATAEVGALAQVGQVALGTDSRLTGERDLLGELQCAAQTGQVSSAALFAMVSTHAAALLRLPFAGRLEPGLPADLMVLPAKEPDPFDNLIAAQRSALSLVMIGGEALYGEPALMAGLLNTASEATSVRVDGSSKWLRRGLAQRLWANGAQEPGFEPDAARPASSHEAALEVNW